MCFGSTTALLSILDALDADRFTLSYGVTAELLDLDPAVDHPIRADMKSPSEVRRAIRDIDLDAVLVVSNHSCVDLYLDLGLPIFFVDIVYWLGGPKDQHFWEAAEATFAQRFPGVETLVTKAVHAPIVVGPLVRTLPSSSQPGKGTLAQLGGGRSKWIQPGCNSLYARHIAACLDSITSLPKPLLICGGSESLACIEPKNPADSDRVLSTLRHHDLLSAMSSCSLYATAPGLNAVFEGLLLPKPLLFLPPQNASQIHQLRAYETAGLVASGLNFPELFASFPSTFEHLSESDLTQLVIDHLPQLGTTAHRELVTAHLDLQLRELESRQPARRAFVQYLGQPGGPRIAESISDWWTRLWM
jgi:hypothetical protein